MAKETMAEKITAAFDKHRDTVDAIMSDSIEPGLIVEVEAACENFQKTLEDFTETEMDVDALIDKIGEIEFSKTGDSGFKDFASAVVNMDDFDAEVFLNEVDESDLTDHLAAEGYLCIKLESLDKMEKLKTFLQTEIYPDYNEQVAFLKY